MRFKAENFEATATEIEGAEPRAWVIEAPGCESHTVRMPLLPDFGTTQALRGESWVDLTMPTKPRPLEKDLATAIAVLYSVPGVVCVEEP